MITEMKVLNLADVRELVEKDGERKEMEDYLKNFCKVSKDKADKMAEELRALDNAKFKEENIMKIIDFLPKDSEDVRKIISETSLDETEINSILEIVKKY